MNKRMQDPLDKQISAMSLKYGKPLADDLVPYAKPRELQIYEQDTNRMNELIADMRRQRFAIDKLRQSRYAMRARFYDRRARTTPETKLAELMDRDAKIQKAKTNDHA